MPPFLPFVALAIAVVVTARELPLRRTRFVASTNGDSESFQPLANDFIQLNRSYNVASAYCSSPGTLTNDTVLPSPPFCYNNWTLPIKLALGDSVYHLPIIQLLGDSGPEKFKIPYIFTRLYVDWALQWGFDGYLIDAEFKGDDAAYVAFINVFGAGLHAVNKSLGVFLYPDMSKAQYINGAPGLDHWLGTWGGKCSTIPNVIWGLHHWNNVSHLIGTNKGANAMLYPRDNACSGSGIDTVFSTMNESRVNELGFWANDGYMGAGWHDGMETFLSGGV